MNYLGYGKRWALQMCIRDRTIAGWVVLAGKNVAQISDGISNPVVAGIINWLIRILICGGCLAVSYTHLDVYKRQILQRACSFPPAVYRRESR